MCVFHLAITEVDASLKFMPLPSQFKSGTCITKKKITNKQLSVPTLQHDLGLNNKIRLGKFGDLIVFKQLDWTASHLAGREILQGVAQMEVFL